MNLDLWNLTQMVVAISKKAGDAILAIYRNPENLSIRLKADTTPVTEADDIAHSIIVDGLAQLNPHFPVVSEEGQLTPYAIRSNWETYWLIDPLDGTKEFIEGTDEFTVNIALIHRHQPVMGVVYIPVTDVGYFACAGQGAYKQEHNNLPERIQVRKYPSDAAVIAVSRRHGLDKLNAFLQGFGPHTIVHKGSSIKVCIIAEGLADMYPSFGHTSEWDTAAAQCVIEEAGGTILDIEKLTPLRYNTKESILNPGFLVVGDKQHNWRR